MNTSYGIYRPKKVVRKDSVLRFQLSTPDMGDIVAVLEDFGYVANLHHFFVLSRGDGLRHCGTVLGEHRTQLRFRPEEAG